MKAVLLAALALAAVLAAGADAAASAPTCRTGGLAVSLRGEGGGVGHLGAFFVLTNRGPAACSVKGYLSLRLLNARRAPMPTSVAHGDTYLHGKDRGPRLIVLRPGGHARAWVEWSDVPSGNEPATRACEPNSSFIRVTLPGGSGGIVVRFRELVCGHGGLLTSALTR
jgi:hypothetical protein